jgi:hypothetical protein
MAHAVPPGSLGTTPAATPAKPPPPDKDQSLAFKVMRLCRPSFHQYQPVAAEPGDVLGELDGVGSSTDGGAGDGFGLTGMLTLPPNFGNIFMGENFSSYISVFNQTDAVVGDVGIKAELQTKTKRLTLLDTTDEPVLHFAGGGNRDFIVESPLRELGTHILVCSAQYVNAAGEKRAFRQFFKFQVQPAFVIKHQTRPIVHGGSTGTLLLEVSVQSCLPGPAFLEDVKFREDATFCHSDWSGKTSSNNADADASCFLAPSDVRRYLYKLKPATLLPLPLLEPVLVGQFDMVWRSALGERGQLQQTVEFMGGANSSPAASGGLEGGAETPADHRVPSREIDLAIVQISSAGSVDGLRSQRVFEVELAVTNASAVPRSLLLMPADSAMKLTLSSGRIASHESMGESAVPADAASTYGRDNSHIATPDKGIEKEREAAEAMTRDAIATRSLDLNTDSGSAGGGIVTLSDSRAGAGVVWAGPAPLEVGTVEPRSSRNVVAKFFPCCVGEHQLPPLALIDTAEVSTTDGEKGDVSGTAKRPLQIFDAFEASPMLLIY